MLFLTISSPYRGADMVLAPAEIHLYVPDCMPHHLVCTEDNLSLTPVNLDDAKRIFIEKTTFHLQMLTAVAKQFWIFN